MEFNLTSEHLAFRDMAADFAEEKLKPQASHWDLDHTFPIDVLKEAASLGMAAMVCQEEHRQFLREIVFGGQLCEPSCKCHALLVVHHQPTKAILVDSASPEP